LTKGHLAAIVKFNLKFTFKRASLAMKTISMLDFRRDAEKIIAQVQKGERMILTRRGKPVARLEPIIAESVSADDPIYSLDALSSDSGSTLTNAQIDDILYDQ
jgi:prevent-host-death family protein